MATPPAFISATDKDTSGVWLDFAATSSFSRTVSCITNTNRAFICVLACGDGRTVSTFTIGGQALSLIGYIAYPSNITVGIYGRMNAPTGNQTLAITLNGNTYGYIAVLQFDKTIGWRSQISSNQGTAQNPSLSAVSLIADDYVLSAINKFNGITGGGAGQTYLHGATGRYGNTCWKTSKVLASNGSSTFSYTSDISDKYAHVVCSLIPVPSSGSCVMWWFKNWLEERRKKLCLYPSSLQI